MNEDFKKEFNEQLDMILTVAFYEPRFREEFKKMIAEYDKEKSQKIILEKKNSSNFGGFVQDDLTQYFDVEWMKRDIRKIVREEVKEVIYEVIEEIEKAKQKPDEKKLLTTKEAKIKYDCSASTLIRWGKKGIIKVTKIGRKVFYD